ITWGEYAALVRDVASGLATLGVRRGEVIGIVGDNRPEWLIAELAAHCLGAAVVGVDPAGTGDDVRRVVGAAEGRVGVAEDQEQVDKLARVGERLAGLTHIIYCDPRGLEPDRDGRLVRLTELAAAGRRDAAERPGWLDGEIAAGAAGDPAVICATPGATG